MTRRRTALLFLLPVVLTGACAVVDSLQAGFRSASSWAEGFFSGQGSLDAGLQQGDWTYENDSGGVRARGRYVDDVQDGPWTYWYANGNKEYEGTFRDGLREGLWRYYHTNASQRAQGHFVRGREQGEWTFWSTRGQITQRGFFQDGLQTGLWTYFSDSGVKSAEGLCYEGVRGGEWEFWGADGELSRQWLPPEESVSDLTYTVDSWEEGAVRREGFAAAGRPQGLWVLRHRNGSPRMVGVFENGTPHGHWVAFASSGERIAAGEVEVGRPRGTWQIVRGGALEPWDASGASPAPPFNGEWSGSDLPTSAGVDAALSIWLSELMAPLGAETRVSLDAPSQPPSAAPSAAEVAVVEDAVPDVPINAQPWTQREIEEYGQYVEAYTTGEQAEKSAVGSRYASRGTGSGEAVIQPADGDEERASDYLGRPLKLTVYKDQEGQDFDLNQLQGKKVVLVVLRGFGGGVCVYCTAQTRAFCSAGAFERFEELGAELQVVFPGPRNGLDAFRRGYDALNDSELPPYGILYKNDFIVSSRLDLEGHKVIPSTFILDEAGVVRFAYIGEHLADRPPVELIFEELERMNRAAEEHSE